MSEKQPPPSGTMTADEAPDTVNMTGKLFAEKIDWLYSIAAALAEADPTNTRAEAVLFYIEELGQKLGRSLSDEERREAQSDIVALVGHSMAFQAEQAVTTPERIDKELNQSQRGKRSALMRRAKSHATALAEEIHAAYPNYTRDEIAKEIPHRWSCFTRVEIIDKKHLKWNLGDLSVPEHSELLISQANR